MPTTIYLPLDNHLNRLIINTGVDLFIKFYLMQKMKPKERFIKSAKWLQTILCLCNVLIMQTSLYGQLLTNNNVLISNTSQITIKGDIQNNTGTTISNNGTIDFTGNWINNSGNSIFGVSTGTVIMNGNNQQILGSDQTIFNNLDLNNGIKTLVVNTTVGGANAISSGVLNCNNSVLDLNSSTLTVNNADGTAITATTGYILSEDANNSSKVVWKIGNTSGIHTIPFGNINGVHIPYSYNLNSGSAGDLTVSTYATIADNTPYPIMPVNVTHIRDAAGTDNSANTVDRFWQVDKTGNGTADYTFTYAATENAANGNINIRAQNWNTSNQGWNAALPGQLNPTAQSVWVQGVSTNGVWALALLANPLPVELLSFTAKAKDNRMVICNWVTASEINNDFFTVLRSKDGINFEELGTVTGNGTTNLQHNYSFNDTNPYKGVSFYSLKQTDINGNYTYSQVESILITSEELQYVVFPNPNDGTFQIKFNAEDNSEAELMLTDASGRIVLTQKLNDASGLQSVSPLNATPGFYFLQIINGNNKFITKVQVLN